ncbi:hypothetical protein J4417_03665 [Candidatus Woesearchaeota archaeon]|nr:hypothetical protein [Candidatus Woesearchaeota archaeon]
MELELKPTEKEVNAWLLHTTQHACQVEYFLHQLGLGRSDPERPHDLVGPGNKFEWSVIQGFAMQYREDTASVQPYVSHSLAFHRQQYHHLMWNGNTLNPNASENDLRVGAVDAICSLLENRSYQGGPHPYEEIWNIAITNPPHKKDWMSILLPDMEQLKQPAVRSIERLVDFPNLGLPSQVYQTIQQRTKDVLEMLKTEQGYNLI